MPVLMCPRKKLWTKTYSTRDQVPTCPVFTRAKIKSRFGILKNFSVTPAFDGNFLWQTITHVGFSIFRFGDKHGLETVTNIQNGVVYQIEVVRPCIYHHHHHHIVLAARISLTLSRHSSLSFIALGRSSGQQPVSSHSCWMYVRAGRPAFARPCVGIHSSWKLKKILYQLFSIKIYQKWSWKWVN